MKKLILLFTILFGVFLLTWAYKINTPINRPDEYAQGYMEDAGNWWDKGKVEVDDDWILDRTVPADYKPVPGEDNLYMVVDKDGNIIGYKRRVKQLDGSYVWETVDPNIPESYEKVEGLDDVYRVVMEDGTVKYYKYVRNDDDTFAWIPCDENGNYLEHENDATTIDGKHVLISGNLYKLLDNHGVTIGYDMRVPSENGTYQWVLTDQPSVEDYTKTAGTGAGNRVLNVPNMDAGADQDMQAMADAMRNLENEASNAGGGNSVTTTYFPGNGNGNGTNIGPVDVTPQGANTIANGDGSYTKTETYTETKTVDGWTSTYQTVVKSTFDKDGNLIRSEQQGPFEIGKTKDLTTEEPPVQADRTNKQDSLPDEYARVCGNYTYDDAMASEVIAKLNAYRTSKKMQSLQVTDTATYLAKLRAADMAAYNTSKEELPTYSSLGKMVQEYDCYTSTAGENLWKTYERDAEEIDSMFQTTDSAYKTRNQKDATQIGVAICRKDGYLYICEVIL